MTQPDAHLDQDAYFALEMSPKAASPKVSVVVPVFNEEGGLDAFMDEIDTAMRGHDFEIVAVDDGSTDETFQTLSAARERHPGLRVIRHAKNAGKSRAIRTGVLAARAPIVATLDGDGQNVPADAPSLIERLQKGDPPLAMIAGERVGRQDTASKKVASRLANGIRGTLLRDGSADTGCGLKVFYRDAYLRLPYFDNMHRYVPALMRREGFEVGFAPVGDRPRAHGRSKYTNLGRFLVGIVDLFGVLWLSARARRPISIREEIE